MTNQPAFPADEPLLPAKDCACSICQQLRAAANAARVGALLDVSRNHFATKTQPQATASAAQGQAVGGRDKRF